MGIESDQLVYDYLSRVGDLAQATPLTAAERARLVTTLREDIDTRRGDTSSGSRRTEATALQRILAGIGTPDEVVSRAVRNGVPSAPAPRGARKREGEYAAGAYPSGPSVPKQAGRSGPAGGGAGGTGAPVDWWRLGGGGAGDGVGAVPELGPGGVPPLSDGTLGELPGWRATYEPDFLDPDHGDPRSARVPTPRGPGADDDGEGGLDPAALPLRRPFLRRLLGRPEPPAEQPDADEDGVEDAAPVRVPLPPMESLAVLILVSAAVLALWYVALLGWFIAYTARRIGRASTHVAGLWLPLLVAAGCGFWLYQHTHGQPPGHPLTSAQFKVSLRSTAGVWLRSAAACSAAFLAWRISRYRRG